MTFLFAAPLADGTHTVAIASGDILDVQGTPINAYSASFSIDTLAPRVTAISVPANAVLSPGSLTVDVTFSEAMQKTNLSSADFSLRGNLRGVNYAATTFAYDATGTVLHLTYQALPDDSYTLTLLAGASGGSFFTDPAGNALDGEFAGAVPSGDGVAGGDFKLGLSLDLEAEAFPSTAARLPSGGLVYDTSLSRTIAYAGDSDRFTLNVDAGQTISVSVTGSANLRSLVQLINPAGTVVASAAAASAGANALLQASSALLTQAGVYTVVVSGTDNTIGLFTVQATLNAALENESWLLNAGNDTIGSAQSLDGSLVPLPRTTSGKQTAVVGGNSEGTVDTLSMDFENGPGLFSNTDPYYTDYPNLWHLTNRPRGEPGHSGNTSFYYGLESTGTYDTGTLNGGYIRSSPIQLPTTGSTSLSFNYILKTEGNVNNLDVASVLISTDGGGNYAASRFE